MLPARWKRLPWRNMLVSRVSQGREGGLCRGGGPEVDDVVGDGPEAHGGHLQAVGDGRPGRKTTALTAIRATVTTGRRAVGFSSFGAG